MVPFIAIKQAGIATHVLPLFLPSYLLLRLRVWKMIPTGGDIQSITRIIVQGIMIDFVKLVILFSD